MSTEHPVHRVAFVDGLDDRTVAAAETLHDTLAGECTDRDVIRLLAGLAAAVAVECGPALTIRLAGAAQLAAENTHPPRSEIARRLLDERFGGAPRG